ncbi:MAG: hypothetical protein EZS28_014508, partial [Streblomastix strix]
SVVAPRKMEISASVRYGQFTCISQTDIYVYTICYPDYRLVGVLSGVVCLRTACSKMLHVELTSSHSSGSTLLHFKLKTYIMKIFSPQMPVVLVVNEVSSPIIKLNVDSSAKQIYKAPLRPPTSSKASLVVLHPMNITVPFVSNLNVLFRITQIPPPSFSRQQQDEKLEFSIINDSLSQISQKIDAPPQLLIPPDDYISLNQVEFIVMLMDVSGSGCGNGSINGGIIGGVSVKFRILSAIPSNQYIIIFSNQQFNIYTSLTEKSF